MGRVLSMTLRSVLENLSGQQVGIAESHLLVNWMVLFFSPAKTTGTPPNHILFLRRSFKVRSTASKQCRCWAETSSQMIKAVQRRSSARVLWAEMAHTLSGWMSIGIRNLEWEVCPLWSKIEAMPDEATARAIREFPRIQFSNRFSTNVFPVPPGPSIKNSPPRSDAMADWIVSRINFCSTFADW